MPLPSFIHRFAPLAAGYDVVLSDVWGVVYNGVAAFPEACDALMRFRAGGGTVILITNAPRPGALVIRMLDRLGVPKDAYDGVISSGDVTVGEIAKRQGQCVFRIGPERDHSLFTGMDVRFGDAESADYAVCTGLFDDETETPDDYRPVLEAMRRRNLPMVCANPDLVVERGDRLVHCAGGIAELYRSLGGEVIYAGKPHEPIYRAALAQAAGVRGRPSALARVLAIGDSIRTDVKGAQAFGIDCLFVTAGIHAEELGARDNPDAGALRAILADAQVSPKAITRSLAW